MINAIVIKDTLDDKEIADDLFKILSSRNIKAHIFSNITELASMLSTLDPQEHYIYFPNVYLRYRCLDKIIELIESKRFDYIKSEKSIFSFKPSVIKIGRDGPYSPNSSKKKFFFTLKPEKIALFYKKPSFSNIPHIFITTYNRDSYLKLTLNCLLHSTADCPEIPIILLLNTPTNEVLRVVYDAMDKSDRIQALKLDKNTAFGAANVGLQWYAPKYVIYAEDDFILPEAVNKLYPYWPYQFLSRLEECDFIAWRTSWQNIPFQDFQEWEEVDYRRSGWYYYTREKIPNVMCQLSMLKTSFWINLYNNKNRSVTDQTILLNSKKVAIPKMVGHHIGWYQQQDGYYNLHNWLQGFNMPHTEVNVKNIRTGEKRHIILKDIKNLKLD